MTDLGLLAGDNNSSALGINERGQVVGYSANDESGEIHAFFWQSGTMIDLGTLGGSLTIALSINERGQIVGESNTALGEVHAVLWMK